MSRYKHDLQISDVCQPQTVGHCIVCQKKLTGKQTKYCSKDCSYEAFNKMMFAKGSSKHIKMEVFARDNGLCANCGIDCEKIQRISDHADSSLYLYCLDINPNDLGSEFIGGKFVNYHEEFRKQYFKEARKIWKDTPLNFGGSCWQADHILEVVHGGKHEMENLQTLCNLCHKKKTAKMERPAKFNQSTLF